MFIIMAYRTGGSIFGAAKAPCKDIDNRVMRFDTLAEAQAKAAEYNARTTPNVRYHAVDGGDNE